MDETRPLNIRLPCNWRPISLLGYGSYGHVYECNVSEPGRSDVRVAVKQVVLNGSDPLDADDVLREIQFLQHCVAFPFIVKYIGVLPPSTLMTPHVPNRSCDDVKMVMEYDPNFYTLAAQLATSAVPEWIGRQIMYQLLCALRYIHMAHIVHGDIKPANVLMTRYGSVVSTKLLDFSCATLVGRPKQTTYHVSRYYRPPELLLGHSQYTEKIDLWGAGCILAELASGRPLFPGTDSFDQLRLISASLGLPPAHMMKPKNARSLHDEMKRTAPKPLMSSTWSSDAFRVLLGLLTIDPSQRWSAHAALADSWFDGIRQPEWELVIPRPFIDCGYERDVSFFYWCSVADTTHDLVSHPAFVEWCRQQYPDTAPETVWTHVRHRQILLELHRCQLMMDELLRQQSLVCPSISTDLPPHHSPMSICSSLSSPSSPSSSPSISPQCIFHN